MSLIAPHQLYTAEGLAEILGCHRQSIYQQRVALPPSIMIGDGERSRRWLGLSIINFLHAKAGLPPVDAAALVMPPGYTPVVDAGAAPEPAAEKDKGSSLDRAIRLPKRKLKQRAGAAS